MTTQNKWDHWLQFSKSKYVKSLHSSFLFFGGMVVMPDSAQGTLWEAGDWTQVNCNMQGKYQPHCTTIFPVCLYTPCLILELGPSFPGLSVLKSEKFSLFWIQY